MIKQLEIIKFIAYKNPGKAPGFLYLLLFSLLIYIAFKPNN